MRDQQLVDFVRGMITDKTEIKVIMDWIEMNPENHKIYNEILNCWALSGIRHENAQVDVDQQFRLFKRKNFRHGN